MHWSGEVRTSRWWRSKISSTSIRPLLRLRLSVIPTPVWANAVAPLSYRSRGIRSISPRCRPTSPNARWPSSFGLNAWSWWRICRAPRAARFRSSNSRRLLRRSATANSSAATKSRRNPIQRQNQPALAIQIGGVSPFAKRGDRFAMIAGFEQNDLLAILDHQCRIDAGSVDQRIEGLLGQPQTHRRGKGHFRSEREAGLEQFFVGNDVAD